MVKFLDGATKSHWIGLSETFILVWLHEEHGLRNSSKIFSLFKTAFKVFAPCVKNEAVNQLKANFISWKATPVSLDYTHRLAVCPHFERHLPPSLWTMVLQTSESVHHSNSSGVPPN